MQHIGIAPYCARRGARRIEQDKIRSLGRLPRAGIGSDLAVYQAAWRNGLSQIEKDRYFPVR